METVEQGEPRIIKKKKHHGGGHGGAWKVAYADFVTAMMALFIVLWIMSQSQSIRLAVAQYFKNPGVLQGSNSLLEKTDMGGEMPTEGLSQALQTPSPAPEQVKEDQGRLEEAKKRIQEIIAQLPELEKMQEQIFMEVTDEGLRIQLLELENSTFFDVGSANLKPESRKILNIIAQELARLPNQVAIEGHTDSRPYGGHNYTNWELSADRANAARRFLESSGLKANQIASVQGFADRQPLIPQNPLDARNRRVSIIVMLDNKAKGLPINLSPELKEKINIKPKTSPQTDKNAAGKILPPAPPATTEEGNPPPPLPSGVSEAGVLSPSLPVPSGKPAPLGQAPVNHDNKISTLKHAPDSPPISPLAPDLMKELQQFGAQVNPADIPGPPPPIPLKPIPIK